MTMDSESLSHFIVQRFSVAPDELSDATPLFSSGLLDSFHLLELIAHIEEQAQIRVSPGEIHLENLDSVERILRFVERRVGS